MRLEEELQRLIQAVDRGPSHDFDDLEPIELDPVARLTSPSEQTTDRGLHAFSIQEQDSPVDAMTSTRQERRQAQETFKQQTPGSAASFQSAQAATMQSPKSWFQKWGGGDTGDLSGFIPTKALAPIENGGHHMKPGAATAYKAMQRAAKKAGINFSITDSYRDYQAQVRLKAEKPTLAATPGHSNHGWGLALDINVNDPATYNWLRKNGKRFGFEQPMSYEPWHWEYHGGYAAPAKPSRSPKRSKSKPVASDPLNRVGGVSSLITAPTVFGSIVAEVENPPQTKQEWKEHEKSAGLGFVPAKYRNLIREAADKANLSARLIAIVMQKESGFDAQAVSSAGAQGLMQIMPLHGLDKPFNPKQNVMFGAQLLANYIEQMGSVRLGLAAYNGGPNKYEAGLDYADTILEALRGGR